MEIFCQVVTRGVTRSLAKRSREIKLYDITRRVKNQSREICELSKLLFVACRGSNAPLLRLDCQNEGGAFEGKEEEEEEQEGKQGKQPQAVRMTSENTRITVEDAPATFKSFVWQHFGYFDLVLHIILFQKKRII